jgi:hypothetical protein
MQQAVAASTRGSGHHPTGGLNQTEERPPTSSGGTFNQRHHRLPERALSSTNYIRDPNRRAFRRVDSRVISVVMRLPSEVERR